ncbi:MAG: glycosyltransferase family 2 protein [Candidatus Doudnabacteria bacterium]|nr:glycosyltransferase family 2 protein [Candidatus Doudnabacteria bacterium]
MKKIVLMPTKNDAWILEKTLKCLLLWADKIIISDQQSTDKTLDICKMFPQVVVLNNPNVFHSTKVRQQLLDEARKEQGNNLIFSIDSDEVVTADIIDSGILSKMEAEKIGTVFQMQWVQLWRSPEVYRDDDSVWSNSYKHFAFIDDRASNYTYEYGVNDHNPRVPTALVENTVKLAMPKVLHFQFVNWNRMLAKQRFYRVQDFLQTKKDFWSALKINKMYFAAKEENHLQTKPVLPEWTVSYLKRGVDLKEIKEEPLYWYDLEVLRWFEKFGLKTFAYLDIWDADWDFKLQQAKLKGGSGLTKNKIIDPRNFLVKAYHSLQRLIYQLYKVVKN